MNRLRIALVHPFSWPEVRRGGERYLADLAWYLDRAGHRVELITGTAGRSSRSNERNVTVRKLRHAAVLRGVSLSDEEAFGLRCYPLLARHRFDVVHAFVPSAALAARSAAQRTVYTVLGHPAPELVATLPRQRRLMRLAVRTATVAVALSRASADASERSFGRATEVLSPGVILDRFPLEPGPRKGPPRLLFNAFASNPEKGLATLLDAFGMLLGRTPDARLVLAGPGDPGPALARIDQRVRAAVDVRGPGALEDVPRDYREATVTVLPSTNEAFGLVLVESLASGTPVVCSDAGGMPEIVAGAAVGRIAPYGDATRLASALDEAIALARDPATADGCRRHAARWDWETRIGPDHERVYRRLAERGAAGD